MLTKEQIAAIAASRGQKIQTLADVAASNRASQLQDAWKPEEPGIVQSVAQYVSNVPKKLFATGGEIVRNVEALKDYLSTVDPEEKQRILDEVSKPKEYDFGYLGKSKPIESAKEAVGVGIEGASYVIPVGKVAKAVTGAAKVLKVVKPTLSSKILKGMLLGTKAGSIAGGMSELGRSVQEDEGLGETIRRTAIGTGFGAVAGGVIGGAIPAIGGGVSGIKQKFFTKSATEASKQVDDLVNKIAQGEIKDIPKVKKALSNINADDIKGIKTYKDLGNVLDDKISAISSKLDDSFGTNTDIKKLAQLKLEQKVGEKLISYNYVDDALNQLDDFYTKTNNQVKLAQIKQLKAVAAKEGLRIRDLNDLAKLHGQELNAFNANGELASGLSKQAAENTRAGLKSTARGLFDDPLYKAADSEIASLIRTRDLALKMAERVNDLQQKIVKRGFGQEVGRLVFNIFDLVTGHTFSGFLRAGLVPRGGGLKVLNALDLERILQKNLKEVNKILSSKLPEKAVIKELENLIYSQADSAQSSQALPTSQSTKNIVNTTPQNPITPKIPPKGNFSKGVVKPLKTTKSPSALSKEAVKYRTPEAFVKAQGKPIYRGQETDIIDFSDFKQKLAPNYSGVAFSRDKAMARNYGKVIHESYIPENQILKPKDIQPSVLKKLRSDWVKIADNSDDMAPTEDLISNVMDIAKNKGKDAADLAQIFPLIAPEAEVRVLSQNALFTKSQLTSIWEKANKLK